MTILDDKTDHDDADTRPAYYGGPDDPYEPVKVIHRVALGPGFYYGSALKYLQRAGKKPGEEERDLKKARWYIANGIKLGYAVPNPMQSQSASLTARAWQSPDNGLLREAVYFLLVGMPQKASDVGGETVIVGRSPKKARHVERSRVQSAKPGTRTETAPRNAVAPDHDKTSLYCSEGPRGLCATQRQSDPPRRGEMAEGVYALCGAWLTGRSAPKRAEPTCPACRSLLGLESESV